MNEMVRFTIIYVSQDVCIYILFMHFCMSCCESKGTVLLLDSGNFKDPLQMKIVV